MPDETIEIYLQDQIPRFRSGKRLVAVLQIGPKWVRLQCGRRTTRISKSAWVEILASTARMNNRANLKR